MDDIDNDFRHIRLDDAGPSQPFRVDRMFSHWETLAETRAPMTTAQPPRPPSPPRRRAAYPLPLPSDKHTSALGGLFDYPELAPLVLNHFDRPSEFAVLARVCGSWRQIAQKRLYEHIWVRPWESGCHFKLVLLFETLHRRPGLCRLVKKLDVRFFPLAARGGERVDLDDQVRSSLGNMTHLESLVWTRDKSLTPELVETLAQLPHLKSFEVSGHSYRYYDPTALGRLPVLEELRIMMPDSCLGEKLVSVIRSLDEREQGGLLSLGLICRSSPLVDDAMLRDMSLALKHLRRLTLWGCIRVTREGVYKILREAEDIEELSLDAMPHSNLLDLSRAPDLPRLHTLSLSFACPAKEFLDITDLPTLPHLPRLESLHLTLSGDKRHLPAGGLPKLLSEVDFTSLRRLSILGLVISTPQLSALVQAAPQLEELYISVNGKNTVMQCDELRQYGLRVLHVNAPERWGPTPDDLAHLASSMPRLEQVGSGNRVYEVFRRLDDGDKPVVELYRWARTTTPAYFQVWRG